ncbi:MAG: enoyl-[acyl-carrier-protein] reductase FabK [Chloroflexi bacterium]|nr:enoyl-[acyl-carrier-protein] reductase FabK [Anaerolineae bacterium]RLC73712.1 MAG: enoyl-[acyl-carrier-protein] reductase FabK [Chloroflexota bacterium]
MIKTRLCTLLGITHPIIQGGMAWVATAELVAAVSEAGGLGILGGGNAPPDYVRAQIRETRQRTDKPFGVNIPLFSPYVDDVVQICIEERVAVVATGAGSPAPVIPPLKEAGIIIVPVVGSVALAKRVARMGADALVAEGMESGGHIGDVATLPLIPQVVDAVDIPVIAAGGIADGRGLAAALALGAEGIQMGTRFICTTECIAHPNYKQKIVQAKDRATITTGYSLGHPVRAIKNPMTRKFQEIERGEEINEEELIELGTGKLRLAVKQGDMVNGSVMAGQISGLIHDVVPTQELIERIVAEAEDILNKMPSLVVHQE